MGKGKKLPTERELAKALRVSRNTISTAYKELEDEGVLYSHQGRGTLWQKRIFPYRANRAKNGYCK